MAAAEAEAVAKAAEQARVANVMARRSARGSARGSARHPGGINGGAGGADGGYGGGYGGGHGGCGASGVFPSARASARSFCSTARGRTELPDTYYFPDAGIRIVGWKRDYTRMLRARNGEPTGVEAATEDAILNVLREAVTVRSVDCLPDDPRFFDPSIHATVDDISVVEQVAEMSSPFAGMPFERIPRLSWRVFKADKDLWNDESGEACLIELPKGDGVTDGFSSVLRMLEQRKRAAAEAQGQMDGSDGEAYSPRSTRRSAASARGSGRTSSRPGVKLPRDAPLFAHADGSSWTIGEVRAAVKASASKLGLNPVEFAERSLNIGGKTDVTGAGRVLRSEKREREAGGLLTSRDVTARGTPFNSARVEYRASARGPHQLQA